jgi:hypothetical protein
MAFKHVFNKLHVRVLVSSTMRTNKALMLIAYKKTKLKSMA